MTFQNPNFLFKTVLNVDITYSNPLLGIAISLVNGSGIDNIMSIDAADDQIVMERTATGDASYYMQPIIVTGNITLSPGSPSIQAIQSLIANMELTGIIVPGSVTVKSPSFNYTLSGFVFSGPKFIGYNFDKKIADYTYPFKCLPPSGIDLAGLANLSGGLINIV